MRLTADDAGRFLALQDLLLQYPRKTRDGLFSSSGKVTADPVDGVYTVPVYADELRSALRSPLSYRVLVDEYDQDTGELIRSDREFLETILLSAEVHEAPVLPHVQAALDRERREETVSEESDL